ncbi:hypothetical protein HZA86_02050 [Candidatus Uhrbacteria bacterium]|nr:hypothetical protein [Candidatus Uhrbacteria bacterium]
MISPPLVEKIGAHLAMRGLVPLSLEVPQLTLLGHLVEELTRDSGVVLTAVAVA